jgi:hypothetical protein
MSTNLDLEQVTENQALKEVSINTMSGELDAALTELLVVDVTAGNVSLTNSQYRRNLGFNVTGAGTVGRTVTLPGIKKLSMYQADSSNTQSIDIVKGSSTYTMSPGAVALLYTDGTANGLTVVSESGAGVVKPYDIGTFCAGLPDTSEKLLRFNYVRSIDLPANLTGSRVTAQTAATAQADFAVTINGSGVGTIRFAAAGTVASFVGFSAQSLVANDVLMIQAPGTQDATLADIAFTIAGTQV